MKTGKVKWFHAGWWRGVITPDTDADDVLFRWQVVEDRVKLEKGDRVEYEAEGNIATFVRGRPALADEVAEGLFGRTGH